MENRFEAALKPVGNGKALWFLFQGRKILVAASEGRVGIPEAAGREELPVSPIRTLYLGQLDGRDCYGAELAKGTEVPPELATQGIRTLHGLVEEPLFKVALRAMHLMDWDRNHRFCARCGVALSWKDDERAKICPACGFTDFPRISPAVIVLVERGDQALLARASRFEEELYSVLAGFVEPGETLEDTVKREVREETGIEVTDIRYFGSQPWPFPDSLMVGFTAKYLGGEIRLQEGEITDARWFSRENLPRIPGKVSIARALIDWFIARGAG